jgi:threonine aldolase
LKLVDMIDLRSDTVTQPTADMRRAIAKADLGDDVYHDDPTVLALEARVAEILGKDDAIYMPTGTMTNQTALRTHTSPGDVVVASRKAHIDHHELGAANAISGLTVHQIGKPDGTFTAEEVQAEMPQPSEALPSSLFQPVTLVAAENTHNSGGGTVWPVDQLRAVAEVARELRIRAHLDGARLWNASVASGVAERDFATGFDTVSVCFSKGLGAPMGSALAGRADLIERARRFKQMLGGGFRQAGMMAAGALYALEHHRERLAEDHANAGRLAAGLAETPGIDVMPVATNMVFFGVTSMSVDDFCAAWSERGVVALPVSADSIRAVTHLGITAADIDKALAAAAEVAAGG